MTIKQNCSAGYGPLQETSNTSSGLACPLCIVTAQAVHRGNRIFLLLLNDCLLKRT